jgi:hypothetical protein
MQYMRNMFDGRAKLEPLDNDRYPAIRDGRPRGMCFPLTRAGYSADVSSKSDSAEGYSRLSCN